MKIGILTFHRSINYGAFLQCFSLITRLKKDFKDCKFEVVDFTPLSVKRHYSAVISTAKTKSLSEQFTEREQAFQQNYSYLDLSSERIETDDYSVIAEYLNSNYDAVIVGSDAVWNWVIRGFPNIYFLKDYHGTKFSYAASAHGMNYEEMTEEQRKYLAEAFDDFNYIGVRDINTENLVHYALPAKTVYHNCDPTVFLELKDVPCDMEALKSKMERHGVDFSKPLIGIMAGDSIGREIKKKYNNSVQLVALYEYNKFSDVYLNDLTPFEWAHIFSFFKLTLTHFFHGTMFSLKNGTPVIAIETLNSFSSTHTTKINDLLNRLELTDWREEINHLHCNKIQRGLYRFGLKSDTELWKCVYKKIDDFLKADYSEEIFEKLSKEAESYNSFRESLNRYLSLKG